VQFQTVNGINSESLRYSHGSKLAGDNPQKGVPHKKNEKPFLIE
jgi:hypothetical protein